MQFVYPLDTLTASRRESDQNGKRTERIKRWFVLVELRRGDLHPEFMHEYDNRTMTAKGCGRAEICRV
jgi:hypothetical protein